eukprot:TRINITY_DN8273_c0_g1_i1.p1 TRINITY_DN8273_c0_g1~~TRINITY_DN8273_c0_g1_i1.p1  ORF type:complete len:3501 (+),score=396.51 TRINITY_DN8273_c0_g1_i1:95-10504(+)
MYKSGLVRSTLVFLLLFVLVASVTPREQAIRIDAGGVYYAVNDIPQIWNLLGVWDSGSGNVYECIAFNKMTGAWYAAPDRPPVGQMNIPLYTFNPDVGSPPTRTAAGSLAGAIFPDLNDCAFDPRDGDHIYVAQQEPLPLEGLVGRVGGVWRVRLSDGFIEEVLDHGSRIQGHYGLAIDGDGYMYSADRDFTQVTVRDMNGGGADTVAIIMTGVDLNPTSPPDPRSDGSIAMTWRQTDGFIYSHTWTSQTIYQTMRFGANIFLNSLMPVASQGSAFKIGSDVPLPNLPPCTAEQRTVYAPTLECSADDITYTACPGTPSIAALHDKDERTTTGPLDGNFVRLSMVLSNPWPITAHVGWRFSRDAASPIMCSIWVSNPTFENNLGTVADCRGQVGLSFSSLSQTLAGETVTIKVHTPTDRIGFAEVWIFDRAPPSGPASVVGGHTTSFPGPSPYTLMPCQSFDDLSLPTAAVFDDPCFGQVLSDTFVDNPDPPLACQDATRTYTLQLPGRVQQSYEYQVVADTGTSGSWTVDVPTSVDCNVASPPTISAIESLVSFSHACMTATPPSYSVTLLSRDDTNMQATFGLNYASMGPCDNTPVSTTFTVDMTFSGATVVDSSFFGVAAPISVSCESCETSALLAIDTSEQVCVPNDAQLGSCPKDDCSSPCNTPSEPCASSYSREYTLTSVAYGASYSACIVIDVEDNLAPVISGVPLVLNHECGTVLLPLTSSATVVDNCDPMPQLSQIATSGTPGSCTGERTYVRTLSATDDTGNQATAPQTVNQVDNTSPVFTPPLPSSYVFPCTDAASATAFDNLMTPALPVIDSCDAVLMSPVAGNTGFSYDTSINALLRVERWSATDDCQNVETAARTITLVDETPPELTVSATRFVYECMPGRPVTFYTPNQIGAQGTPTAVDWCEDLLPMPSLSLSNTDDVTFDSSWSGCEHRGVLEREWRAVDSAGNDATVMQTVVVEDNTAPQLDLSSVTTYDCSAYPNFEGPTTSDNCAGANRLRLDVDTLEITKPKGLACADTEQRKQFSLTDQCAPLDDMNRVSTMSQWFSWIDDTEPVLFDLPPSTMDTFMCTANNVDPPEVDVRATDDCHAFNAVVVELDETVMLEGSPLQRVIRRTWTATDPCDNAASSLTYTIEIVDAELGFFSPPPVKRTYNCQAGGDIRTDYPPAVTGTPTVVDPCATQPHILSNGDDYTLQVCEHAGIIERMWESVDGTGMGPSAFQTIVVRDIVAPALTITGSNVQDCSIYPTLPAFSVDDNCSPPTSLTTSQTMVEDLSTSPPGCATYEQRWLFEVVDECQPMGSPYRSTAVERVLLWRDVTPPDLVVDVTTVDVLCTEPYSDAALGATPAVAMDDCSGTGMVVQVTDSVVNYCPGRKRVERQYSATDACGLTTRKTKVIRVSDVPPEITLAAAAQDITLDCQDPYDVESLGTLENDITLSDACGDTSFSVRHSDITVEVGELYRRIFFVVDSCRRTSSVEQTIRIADLTAPVFEPRQSYFELECVAGGVDLAVIGPPGVDDVCGVVVSLLPSVAPLPIASCTADGVRERTWIATDDSTNTAELVETIAVIDTQPPQLTVPDSLVSECTPARFSAFPTDASATDVCSGPLNVNVLESGERVAGDMCGAEAFVVRTYSSADDCGLTASGRQTVTLRDTAPPVLPVAALSSFALECNVDAVPPPPTGLVAQDACEGTIPLTVSETVRLQGCGDARTVVRRWSATDGCGNTATHLQTISIVDTRAPVITGTPADIALECSQALDLGDFSVVGELQVRDECNSPVGVQYSDLSDPRCGQTQVVTRSWTAVDTCNALRVSHEQQITVVDTTDPQWVRQLPTARVECGAEYDPEDTGEPAASHVEDECAGTALTVTFSDSSLVTCGASGAVRREWRAVDPCGNFATYIQSIIIVDTEPPSLTAPESTVILCPADTSSASQGVATASDTCSADANLLIRESDIALESCGAASSVRRVWSAEDECGLRSIAEQTIFVQDNEPPSFTFFPARTTAECGVPAELLPLQTGIPLTLDECDGPGSAQEYDDSFVSSCGSAGIVSRAWTATDGCGNSVRGFQTIDIVDMVPPVMDLVAGAEVNVECGADISDGGIGGVVVSDACTPTPGINVSHVDSRVATTIGAWCGYETTRVWRAKDECKNKQQLVQLIRERDTSAPYFVEAFRTRTVRCDANFTAGALEGEVIAQDACALTTEGAGGGITVSSDDGPITKTCPGGEGSAGWFVRTWSATDACGHSLQEMQSVFLTDAEAPQFTATPESLSVECGVGSPFDAALVGTATAQDNCDAVVEITNSTTERRLGCNVRLSKVWTAEDGCGNAAEYLQLIDVIDTLPPQVSLDAAAHILLECGVDPVPEFAMATASDLCDTEPTLTSEDVSESTCAHDTALMKRKWVAVDRCGNRNETEQVFELVDTLPPVLSFSSPLALTCSNDTSIAALGSATAVDDCTSSDRLTLEHDDVEVSRGFCNGLIHRQWTATDPCGNEVQAIQSLVFTDVTPPTIADVPDVVLRCDANGDYDVQSLLPGAAADDCTADPTLNFADQVVATSLDSCFARNISRTWTARDECGNKAVAVQSIFVVDVDGPLVELQESSLNLTCSESREPDGRPGYPFVIDCSPDGSVTWSDSIVHWGAIAGAASAHSEFGSCVDGSIVRTWTAEDGCGNSEYAVQTIHVRDEHGPRVRSLPRDVTDLQCGVDVMRVWSSESERWESDIQEHVDLGAPEMVDDCSLLGPLEVSVEDRISAASCAGSWTLQRRFSGADACGNEAHLGTQNVRVVDNSAPEMMVPPDRVYECGEQVIEEYASDVWDTCLGNYQDWPELFEIGREEIVALDSACERRVDVVHTVRDACGNNKNGLQKLTIKDTQAPELYANFELLQPSIEIECSGPGDPQAVVESSAWAEDACSGALPVQLEESRSQSCGGSRSISRRWVATDECGHATELTQQWDVVDSTPPNILLEVERVVERCSSFEPILTAQFVPEDMYGAYGIAVFDACSQVQVNVVDGGSDSLDCDTQAEDLFYLRTFTALDECGNQARVAQSVTVLRDDRMDGRPGPVSSGRPEGMLVGPEEDAAPIETSPPEMMVQLVISSPSPTPSPTPSSDSGELEVGDSDNPMVPGTSELMASGGPAGSEMDPLVDMQTLSPIEQGIGPTGASNAMQESMNENEAMAGGVCSGQLDGIGATSCSVIFQEVRVNALPKDIGAGRVSAPTTVTAQGLNGELLATVEIETIDIPSDELRVPLIRIATAPEENIDTLLRSNAVQSAIIEVTLVDDRGRQILFDGSVELCFTVPSDVDEDDVCIGFLNMKNMQPHCADVCPDKKTVASEDGEERTVICGNAEHFTSFAVLLKGANVNGDGGACATIEVQYAFGSWTADIAVTSGVMGAAALIILALVICAHRIPFLKEYLKASGGRNKELVKLRKEREAYRDGIAETNDPSMSELLTPRSELLTPRSIS